MFSDNMALADAALAGVLRLISDNKDLLSTDQRNMLLDTRENLRKQHRELEPPTWKWFGSGSDKSKKHLENCQKFFSQVEDTLEETLVANIRRGCASSTPTDKSFDTAKASTYQPSKDLQSLEGGVGATTAPPNPQDGNTGVSYSEMPPPYTSASADAINTPLAPRRPSIGQQSPRGGVEATAAPPNPQGRNTKISSSKTAPPHASASKNAIGTPPVAATAKQASSGKAGWPRPPPPKRHTEMSGFNGFDGFDTHGSGSAEGLTINMGGTGNCGSAIHIRVA
ncbi:hypothetical protein PAXINDRAFT_8679 [Paxillus involutus ATCC 200175]|nr:hypothetical protein PAXINDRAFT_8679 [Paxillus involutus ATCC 200175]